MPDRDDLEALLGAYYLHAPDPSTGRGLEERILARREAASLHVRAATVFAFLFLALAIAGMGLIAAQMLRAGRPPGLAAPRHADLGVPCPAAAPPVSDPVPVGVTDGQRSQFDLPVLPFVTPGWAAAAATKDVVRDAGLPRVEVDPTDLCFMVISGAPSFVSADGGRSWGRTADAVSLGSENGRRVLISETGIGGAGKLLLSRDDGRTWKAPVGKLTELGSGHHAGDGVWLAFEGDRMWRGLLRSREFRSYTIPDELENGFEWSHGGHETVLAYGRGGALMYKRDSGGFEWSAFPPELPRENGIPLPEQDVHSLAVWPGTDVVLASRGFGGLVRSTDGGATWSQVTDDLLVPGDWTIGPEVTPGAGRAARTSPTVNGLDTYLVGGRPILYAATGNGPLKTTDDGRTWQWLHGFPVSEIDRSVSWNLEGYAVIPQGDEVFALADPLHVVLVRGDSGRILPPLLPSVDPRPLGGQDGWLGALLRQAIPFFLLLLLAGAALALIDWLRKRAISRLSRT
jgi:photosystem II stability/assembly factor-like uncharacterized protein